jgi:hypothetical protein
MDDRKHAIHFYLDRLSACLVHARLRPCEQISIAIALTLGVALSIPWSAPTFSVSAASNTAMQKRIAPPLRSSALVVVLVRQKYLSDDDADLLRGGPVLDFGLYYGSGIQLTIPLPARVQISSGSKKHDV